MEQSNLRVSEKVAGSTSLLPNPVLFNDANSGIRAERSIGGVARKLNGALRPGSAARSVTRSSHSNASVRSLILGRDI